MYFIKVYTFSPKPLIHQNPLIFDDKFNRVINETTDRCSNTRDTQFLRYPTHTQSNPF